MKTCRCWLCQKTVPCLGVVFEENLRRDLVAACPPCLAEAEATYPDRVRRIPTKDDTLVSPLPSPP